MKNSLVLLAVVLSVAAFAGMMRIKTDVQTMDRERMKLVRERAELRETKRVLEAEWALLASPERLERMVRGKNYVAASALDVVPLSGLQGARVSGSQVVAVSANVAVSPVVVVPVAVAPAKMEDPEEEQDQGPIEAALEAGVVSASDVVVPASPTER